MSAYPHERPCQIEGCGECEAAQSGQGQGGVVSSQSRQSGIEWHDPGMDDFERKYMGQFPVPTPGQTLYERWCGSRRSHRARYFQRMNPAEKRAWENLAVDLIETAGGDAFNRVIHNLPEHER